MESNKYLPYLITEELETIALKEVCSMADELMWFRIFEYMQEQHAKHPEYTPTKLLYMFYDSEMENMMDEADYEEEDDDADSV